MTISTWSKLGLLVVALFLTGQSCSISLGTPTRQDGGIFRSDDHGQNWQQKTFVSQDKKRRISIDDVTGRVLVYNPTDSNHLYLGTLASGIWTSTDRGDRWQATSLRSGTFDCIAFDPQNPRVMYTATGAVVLKSVDGGVAWTTAYTESQPGHLVNCVAIDPLDGRTVWATTSGGKVLISNDYGAQWTLIGMIPAMEPRLFHVVPDGSGQIILFTKTNGIMKGEQRGKAWADLTKPLATLAGATDIRAVSVQPSGWYIATLYGLLRSTDQGQTWNRIPTLVSPSSVPIQSIAVNPQNPAELFITTDQRLHHTTDGGASWAVTNLPTSRVPYLMSFDPGNTDRLYFMTYKPKKK